MKKIKKSAEKKTKSYYSFDGARKGQSFTNFSYPVFCLKKDLKKISEKIQKIVGSNYTMKTFFLGKRKIKEQEFINEIETSKLSLADFYKKIESEHLRGVK